LSQIHYQDISLQDLVDRSALILVVKTAKPGQRQIQIPIGKDRSNKPAPPFTRVQVRCEVQAALSEGAAALVGKTLEIDGAHWEQSLSMHKRYYLQGMSISPIYQHYRAAEEPTDAKDPGAPYIVFLRREGKDGYAFTVDGAIEHVNQREAIEAIIRAKK
jgi:hypothetical protein